MLALADSNEVAAFTTTKPTCAAKATAAPARVALAVYSTARFAYRTVRAPNRSSATANSFADVAKAATPSSARTAAPTALRVYEQSHPHDFHDGDGGSSFYGHM